MEQVIIDDYDHVDASIIYTPTSIPGKGCDPNLFCSQLRIKCICSAGCEEPSICACLQNQGQNYENRMLLDTILLGERSVVECNDNCVCPVTCQNRVVQSGPTTGLKIIKSPGKGYAVITTRRIMKGQFVCEYAGEIISSEEAIARRNYDKNHNFIFLLNECGADVVTKTIVDATRIGNVGRYINHSCEPNCRVIPVRIDSAVPKLAIFASQVIDVGEEVTYSYGSMIIASGDTNDAFKRCLCGAVSCKKFLPHES